MFGWQKCAAIPGTLVLGDKSQRPLSAHKWQRRIQKVVRARIEWDKIVFLNADSQGQPYCIGFTDVFGDTYIRTKLVETPIFAVLIGYEDVTFFAVSVHDMSVQFEVRQCGIVPKDTPLIDSITLI